MMIDLLNVAIVAGYAVLTVLLFDHGTLPCEPRVRRIKFATLGLAFLCFGMGRLNADPDPARLMSWIFALGHLSFQAFGTAYLWTAKRRLAAERVKR